MPSTLVGKHPKIPHAAYHAIDALNQTVLSGMLRSPAYCKMLKEQPMVETDSMRIGSALHTLFLEGPNEFDERFHVWDGTRRTKAGKLEYDKILKSGRTILRVNEWLSIREMYAQLSKDRTVMELMESSLGTEETALWERDGVLCKSRKDVVGETWIADLKTTRSIKSFNRELTNLGYYRQAAWYMDGEARLGCPANDFFFILVNNTPPFETAVLRLEEAAIVMGAHECQQLFHLYKDCLDAGEWPSAENEIGEACRAQWKYDEINDGEELVI